MAQRFSTQAEFDAEKDKLLELVVLHARRPDLFEAPRLTQDELAVLWAKDKDDVKTKMTVCKFEQKTLRKVKERLAEYGITSLDDALDLSKDRERGDPVKAVNHD